MTAAPGKLLLTLVLPAAGVAAVTFFLVAVQAGAESATANLANILPIGIAFAAGMVASVNPCGFIMLPTYISYHLGTEEEGYDESPPLRRLLSSLRLGLAATAGFVCVAAAAGIVIVAGGRWLRAVFPLAGVLIGVGLLGLGIWLLATGRDLTVIAASRVHVSPRRNLANVFLFGIAYSVASLSCSLPVFVAVVFQALGTGDWLGSAGQFVGYGLGMGAVLTAVTVGAALFRGAVARFLRGAMPWVHRTSVLFLLAAGAYLLWYWIVYADAFRGGGSG